MVMSPLREINNHPSLDLATIRFYFAGAKEKARCLAGLLVKSLLRPQRVR
jgi:hypothetical protein